GVLAVARHLRIQFEWLQVDVGVHLVAQSCQRLLQAGEPDRAPRAGYVGNEIDAERGGHGHGVAMHGGRTAYIEAATLESTERTRTINIRRSVPAPISAAPACRSRCRP